MGKGDFMNKHYLHLKHDPFIRIKEERKTVELRLNDEKRQKIHCGDHLIFTDLMTQESIEVIVLERIEADSFEKLFHELPLDVLGDTSYPDMSQYYSPEKQEKYGVLGIRIQLLSTYILEHLRNINHLVLAPHDNPDVDALISMKLFSKILSNHGISHEIALRSKPDSITQELIKKNHLYHPLVYKTKIDPEDQLFLTDCNTLIGCETQIIGCIDHHPTKVLPNYHLYENGAYSSCTKRIYDLFLSDRVDEELIWNVVYSIYMDTVSMKSSKFNESDRPWVKRMVEKYHFDEDYLRMEGYYLNDLSLSVDQLITNGEKSYILPNGKKAYITYLSITILHEGLVERLKKGMLAYLKTHPYDYFLLILVALEEDRSYIIRYDHEFQLLTYTGILSRSVDVYPMLERENRV